MIDTPSPPPQHAVHHFTVRPILTPRRPILTIEYDHLCIDPCHFGRVGDWQYYVLLQHVFWTSNGMDIHDVVAGVVARLRSIQTLSIKTRSTLWPCGKCGASNNCRCNSYHAISCWYVRDTPRAHTTKIDSMDRLDRLCRHHSCTRFIDIG